MLLTFSKDSFVESIKSGIKIHTIRADESGRWKPGQKIHFWRRNPRNTKGNPYPFGESICKSVQTIGIDPVAKKVEIGLNGIENELSISGINLLAFQDGFNSVDEFWAWFNKPFYGKIIHWTEYMYK